MDHERIENEVFDSFVASGLSKDEFRIVIFSEVNDLRDYLLERLSDW